MNTMISLQEIFTHDFFRQYIFSGDWSLINALIILMFIDIATGLIKAFKNKNLWSRKSLYGFGRKMLIFVIITVANLLDFIMELEGVLVLATVTFYIINEVLSVTENIAQMGIPLPKKLVDVLEVIQKQDSLTDIGNSQVNIHDNSKVEVKNKDEKKGGGKNE